MRPTSVEPVNESLRTAVWWSIALTAGPGFAGVTQLTTPGGAPARSSRSTRYVAVSGVSLAGFRTTVQPAPRAGPILEVAIAAGTADQDGRASPAASTAAMQSSTLVSAGGTQPPLM